MEVVHNLEHTLEETLEYARKRRLEIVWFEGELTQSERHLAKILLYKACR